MKLLEHKGKELFRHCGIPVPPGIVVNNTSYINLSYHKERYREFFFDHRHVIIKAQVISGKRKKQGLIATADEYQESLTAIDQLYQANFQNLPIDTLLIEKRLGVAAEYFLSIVYDTNTRRPMILFSVGGGIDIEEGTDTLVRWHPAAVDRLYDFEARAIAKQAGAQGSDVLQLATFIKRAYRCFIDYDCIACEINPIIKTTDGLLYAGDAKVTIDDGAIARHEFFADVVDTEDKSFLSERELEARRIDYQDHRGVAGKTFVELDGDIAVLASGGGASLTCMDALIEAGGQPANYTEYSGNPSREKVKKLTELTLGKPGLAGCLVIGGTANFTDIFETLSGFADGLLEVNPKPDYPIVIRRAGPRDAEAFAMLREFAVKHQFDITLYDETTPMTLAAKMAVEKVAAYKAQKGK
jgi:succinyl-CoA synthetase beta subunit